MHKSSEDMYGEKHFCYFRVAPLLIIQIAFRSYISVCIRDSYISVCIRDHKKIEFNSLQFLVMLFLICLELLSTNTVYYVASSCSAEKVHATLSPLIATHSSELTYKFIICNTHSSALWCARCVTLHLVHHHNIL